MSIANSTKDLNTMIQDNDLQETTLKDQESQSTDFSDLLSENDRNVWKLTQRKHTKAEIYGQNFSNEENSSQNTSYLQDLSKLALKTSVIRKIDLALVSYLEQHFPLANHTVQESFNVVLFALFNKMQGGDVCIHIKYLDSIFLSIEDWMANLGRKAEGCSLVPRNANEAFLYAIRHYCPRSVEEVLTLLDCSFAVGTAADQLTPLVLDLDRIYMRRFFNYEMTVSNYISNAINYDLSADTLAKLKKAITILFVDDSQQEVNWQKIATLMATISNFTVISGGPGTGKTTTVLRILLLLICLDSQNRLIGLCAPTGKAAARMSESIMQQLKDERTLKLLEDLSQVFGLKADFIKSLVPTEAMTVHSMLKVRPRHAKPNYNENNKLLYDILVIDEVSMLDLPLFAKVLVALPEHCKLILLGDKDQLSSVEAGSILADICARLEEQSNERINQKTLDFLSQMTGYSTQAILRGKIADHAVLLQFSYRSKDVPAIGELANLINDSLIVSSLDKYRNQHEFVVSNSRESIQSLSAELSLNDSFNQDAIGSIEHGIEPQSFVKQSFTHLTECNIEDFLNRNSSLIFRDSFEENTKNNFNPQLKAINQLFKKYGGDDNSIYSKINSYMDLQELAKQGYDTNELNDLSERLKIKSTQPIIFERLVSNDTTRLRKQCLSFAKRSVERGREDNYAPYLEYLEKNNFVIDLNSSDCEYIFSLMNRYRILCSNHEDLLGEININNMIEQEIHYQYLNGYRDYARGDFFPGQILLITKNDAILGVVNGDVGFCAFVTNSKNGVEDFNTIKERGLKLFLPSSIDMDKKETSNKVKTISTILLKTVESGFAMSIHKSQGSEYDKASIVLSRKANQVLTKELVYTGITRAKKQVEILSNFHVFDYAISHTVERESGLAQRLAKNLEHNHREV